MRRVLTKKLCSLSLVLMLATLGALIAIDLHLRNAVSPQGIVSFELCAYTGSCRAIVEAWGPVGQVWAGRRSRDWVYRGAEASVDSGRIRNPGAAAGTKADAALRLARFPRAEEWFGRGR